MKLAIEHCPEVGRDIFNEMPGPFGTICLMANDQFHYSLLVSPAKSQLIDRDKIMRVLTEFVAVTEYGGSRGERRIVRSHLMITDHVNRLRQDPDFVDIAAEFENHVHISLEDYEALAFGLFSRCANLGLSALQKDSWVAAVREENFYTTALSHEVIKRFISELNIFPAQAVTRIHSRDFGANDFTVFRDKPLLVERYGMLAADILFLLEKCESGPYWTVNNINRTIGNKLRRFWGRVFESYTNEQIAEAARQSGALFIPDPRRADDASVQLCDALLLEGDALVILEYKSSMFSAAAKYNGDHLGLLGQISRKLVRDEEAAKKKGVEQLADAVKQLFVDSGEMIVKGLDTSHVKRVYPLLVTLDDLGGSLLMSFLLNTYFDEFLRREDFHSLSIRPLFCTDIETMELILPFGDILPLHGFLQHWLDADEKLMATLQAYLPDRLPARSNQILESAWRILSNRIEHKLFP
jgi:hypothetical protein